MEYIKNQIKRGKSQKWGVAIKKEVWEIFGKKEYFQKRLDTIKLNLLTLIYIKYQASYTLYNSEIIIIFCELSKNV